MWNVMAIVLLWGGAASAQTVYVLPSDEEAAHFVTNEVIATFYHEVAHALIDVLGLPVLGKEEDAADHLSVILMDDIWEESSAADILASSATAFALQAEQREAGGEELAYADTHSLDLQRYYTVVCLFYGANPDLRQKLADDLELPSERAEGCAAEWDIAAASWEAVLVDAAAGEGKKGLVMAAGQEGQALAGILAEEVTAINARFGLPEPVTVQLADCGEANAFYDPEDRSITLCTEYAQDLQDMWQGQAK